MAIKIKTDREIALIRDAGRLAAEILARAGELVKPGITTDEINTFVHEATIKAGAYPSPLNYHGFPKSVCTSVNNVVCHGIPGDYVLKEGDIINIDVTCQLNGYHGDTSRTFAVGQISKEARQLMEVAERAMDDGIAAAVPGGWFGDIGDAIQELADEFGYGVVREFCGHGIGRGFHEEPNVLHYRSRNRGERIREGMVFTVEPMLNAGKADVYVDRHDGWTVYTKDGSLSAQFEHTIAMTRNGPEVLTRLD
jgi:methionyl aminopeptidase